MFDESNPLDPGTEIVVKEGRKRTCAAKMILGFVSGAEYVVLSPDGHVGPEDFSDTKFKVCLRFVDRSFPLLMGENGDDFDPVPDQNEFETLVDQASADTKPC